MVAKNTKHCTQCAGPLPTDHHTDICGKCRTALFALAADDSFDSEIVSTPPAPQTAEEIWRILQPVLPARDYLRELGRGGMGTVSLLENRKLDRFEALKVLLPELADDPRFVERFLRESKTLAKLRHPNIVAIYDCSERDDVLYLLMEYVDGSTLRHAANSDSLTIPQRVEVVTQLSKGLAHAHSEGVIHRDINPANVLLTRNGQVKIADFGLSKHDDPDIDQHLVTRPQEIFGTFGYLAPEQLNGQSSGDMRSDVYSLGVVCYELFTKHLPHGVFSPPSEDSDLPPAFDPVVLKALEQDSRKRFANAREFADAWQAAIDSTSNPRKPLSKTLISTGVGFVILLFILQLFNGDSAPENTTNGPSDQTASETANVSLTPGTDFELPDLTMPFKWVSPGSFVMGALNSGDTDASPPLTAEVTYGFWMGIHEVTQRQYFNLMGNNPSYFNAARTGSETTGASMDWRQRPVESLSWREAMAFCDRLTEISRRNETIPKTFRFRLPTEIEWEYVCRAGETSTQRSNFYQATWQVQAWTFEDLPDVQETQEIGTKPPNAWGFYDLLGNVSEYCLNGWWYYADQPGKSVTNWVSHSPQVDRIFRGGNFAQDYTRATPYRRSSNAIDERDLAQGFRVVLSEELPFVKTMLESQHPNSFEIAALGLQLNWIPPVSSSWEKTRRIPLEAERSIPRHR